MSSYEATYTVEWYVVNLWRFYLDGRVRGSMSSPWPAHRLGDSTWTRHCHGT